MSIAGGYYKAVRAAQAAGGDTVQLFTKNNNQWRAKPLAADDIRRFRDALRDCHIEQPVAHACYLINLASPNADLWTKSIDAFVTELLRCESLGIRYLVTHPGSHLGAGEEAGLRRVADALDEVHRQTRGLQAVTLLESTAGQGSNLGHRLEHLSEMLHRVADPDRLGVCLDTCHLHAAGYALGTPRRYHATMRQLDRLVGCRLVKAIHLNDSKRELGSRVDRHEHIGRGQLGLEPFRLLLNDRRFRGIPMHIETPKGTENGEDLDVINLRVLRSLIKD
jgi:deoxyribonuclease-4